MRAFGITVTARMKHAGLWAAAKRLGGQSKLALALGVSPQDLGRWCNLKQVPSPARMGDAEFQKRFLDVVGEMPEDAFPPELRDAADFLKAPKTIEATQQFDLLRLAERQADRLTLPSPETEMEIKEQTAAVAKLLSGLSERERVVVKLRYGFDVLGGEGMTLANAARVVNVSQERVRQIEKRAIKRLQRSASLAKVIDVL